MQVRREKALKSGLRWRPPTDRCAVPRLIQLEQREVLTLISRQTGDDQRMASYRLVTDKRPFGFINLGESRWLLVAGHRALIRVSP